MLKQTFVSHACVLALTAISSSTAQAQTQVSLATDKPAVAIQAPIQLTGLNVAPTAPNQAGRLTASLPCNDSNGREWSELLAQRVSKELREVFAEEMSQVARFGSQLLAVNVKADLSDMDLQVCNFGAGAWKGEMSVRLNWESQLVGSNQAALKLNTTGYFRQSDPASTSGAKAMREALRMAVKGLIADRSFAALSNQAPSVAVASAK